jgi:CHAT domain-containing protein/tetratricopeptide (TPR) repeat protein
LTELPLSRMWHAALLVVVVTTLSGCQKRSVGDSGVAEALIAAGRFDEAETVARAGVDAARAAHGDSAVQLASAFDVLVRALVLNGRAASEETLGLAQRTLRMKEAHFGSDQPEIVPSLLNLSDALAAAADFDQALAASTKAVVLSEKAFGADSLELASALDHLGRALAGATRYDEALTALARGLRLREALLESTDVALARTLEDMGLVLQRKGEYAKAGAALRRAAAIQQESDGNHPAYTTTLNLIAQQLWFEGQLKESKAASEGAVELAQRTLRPNHPTAALAMRYLAATLGDLGDLTGYFELTKRALALAEQNFGIRHFVTAEYLHQLGVAEMERGDYGAARQHLQQALKSYESRYGVRHEHVATVLSVLALADARLGDFASARREQERAAAVYAEVGGPNHPFVAIALTELAGIYNEQGLPTQAFPLLQRALAIRETNLGPTHRDVARTLADMASTLMQLREPVRAQLMARRALGIWGRLDAPDAPEYATVLALYADLQATRGDSAAALEYYERALAIRGRVFGLSNPVYAEAQSGLAVAQASLGDRAAALRTAADAEATGRDHLRLLLRSLPERQALNYAAARPRGLNLMLSLAGSMPEAVAPALDDLIRGRALVLDEIAARQGATGRPAKPDEPARMALRSAQQRLANLTVRGPGVLSPAQYAAVVEEARRESEAAEETLAERSASYRAERTRNHLGLDEVGRALANGSALVSFVQYDRISLAPPGTPAPSKRAQTPSRAEPSYLAFVSRPDRAPVAVPLGSVRAIDRLVSRWRADIAAEALRLAPRGATAIPAAWTSGAALRRVVWDPLLPHLTQQDRVFVVPDGALGLVPFAALPVGPRSFLLETGPVIHYLSAERDVVSMNGGRISTAGMLAIGGPAFDEVLASLTPSTALSTAPGNGPETAPGNGPETATLRTGAGAAGACGSLQALRFEPLDGTLQEVQELSRLWPSPLGATRALVGREAGERVFKQDANKYRVLHLATHGFFLDGSCLPESAGASTRGVGGLSATKPVENPLRLSGLALAGANRRALAGPDEDDGILTAEEVASLDLQGVEWAVLSACDTGVGEIKAGEGVFGLRRAFQVAGARTVVMSLWSVDDQATRAWMRALYEGRFQRKLSTADAVHQASLTVLRDRRARGLSTHPFYWAAFVAAGDWR